MKFLVICRAIEPSPLPYAEQIELLETTQQLLQSSHDARVVQTLSFAGERTFAFVVETATARGSRRNRLRAPSGAALFVRGSCPPGGAERGRDSRALRPLMATSGRAGGALPDPRSGASASEEDEPGVLRQRLECWRSGASRTSRGRGWSNARFAEWLGDLWVHLLVRPLPRGSTSRRGSPPR